jgi:putative methyltransferase (TIGR04325 family)
LGERSIAPSGKASIGAARLRKEPIAPARTVESSESPATRVKGGAMSGTRTIVKSMIPPALLGAARRLAAVGSRFTGPMPGWDDAQRASSGYTIDAILDRVQAATRAVSAGQAAFERDSVLFPREAHRFPLLAALMHAAARGRGCLHVIDFGGALGSVYWQYRNQLSGLQELRWVVVEQPSFVDAGRREFTHGPLEFVATVGEAAARTRTPLILASSVLQYLPAPYPVLDQFAATDASALLIDRTPVSDETQDHVCIQRVPRRIYDASYPSWVFSRRRLLDQLYARWQPIWDLPCDEGNHRSSGGLRFDYEGYYLERRS